MAGKPKRYKRILCTISTGLEKCFDLPVFSGSALRNSSVANSIIQGAHIHIFLFPDHKNNRFQKKLVLQNTNIYEYGPPQLSSLLRHCYAQHPFIIHLRTKTNKNPLPDDHLKKMKKNSILKLSFVF